jgi:hypothetical protein
MSLAAEVQCILILDLARDNPLDEPTFASLLPASTHRRVYRATYFGAEPSDVGGAPDQRGWRAWTEAGPHAGEGTRGSR